MSDQVTVPKEYSELRNTYQYHIDLYNALYRLKTVDEEELDKNYKMIKTFKNIVNNIFGIIPYNNRYIISYLKPAKFIFDLKDVKDIKITSDMPFYKEFGTIFGDHSIFFNYHCHIHKENTIYNAIMYNDKERFIKLTETNGFNEYQQLSNDLFPDIPSYSFLELCCYYGAEIIKNKI